MKTQADDILASLTDWKTITTVSKELHLTRSRVREVLMRLRDEKKVEARETGFGKEWRRVDA